MGYTNLCLRSKAEGFRACASRFEPTIPMVQNLEDGAPLEASYRALKLTVS